MDIQNFKSELEKIGFRIYKDHENRGPDCNWYACRDIKGLPDCVCNQKSPQLVIRPWKMEFPDRKILLERAEIEINGEVDGGIWLKLQAYSVDVGNENFFNDLGYIESVLSAAWTAARNYKAGA